ncbi:MAG TPA: tripartite tricarboxylate transporter substrate binding protein [Pseudolabrys sp.]|nr:tripartite tricarboxylate transporter substrate binding protein [Pseudolabrys sp.]
MTAEFAYASPRAPRIAAVNSRTIPPMLSLRRSLLAFAFVVSAVLTIAAPASAQNWPQRPVRFILPIGPGAGVDITARLLADKLSARWGQPVVVENRPGGDAILAITTVLNAHDDHVLLFAPASAFTAHPLLHDKLPYKIQDLAPIARVTNTLIGVAVPTSLGVSSLKDFVAKVRSEPGKLNYASATGANDLLFAAFLKTEKLDMAKVPYKDTVQAVNDLAESRVHGYVAAYAILRPRVQAGKIKVLALTNPNHAAALPDIPTAKEAGFDALTMDGLSGLFGPQSMPPAVRERIAKDIREVVADKTIEQRLSATGQVVNPGTPAEFAAAIDEQRATVKKIGETLGIKPAAQ